jgi:branched-chain amino acid transport system substrate-binding protein
MHPLAAGVLLLVATAGDPIKIGVYGPFTGGSAGMGISMRNGVRLAAEQINARGGVLGRRVVLLERDDEARNERGGQIMQELLERERVAAVLGPINTGVADAALRYPNEKRVPELINVSAGAKVNELFAVYPDNYVFRLAAGDPIQSEMIVAEAVGRRGHRRPALLCDDTNYGQNGRAKIEAALAQRGVKAVYAGKFRIGDTDMTAQLREAKAAGADVLLAYGIGPELAAVANSMERVGWKVDLIGSWTLSMASFIAKAGRNGDGATMPLTFIEAGASTPVQQAFLEAYRKRFAERPIAVAVAAAQGYDSMNLIARAIAQAGSTEGPRLRAALEDLEGTYEGVTGTYTRPFSPTDHEAVKAGRVTMGVVRGGVVLPPGNQ